MRFDALYRERATLRDGREVLIRLLQPRDKPKLARGFYRLSDEGRYRRFLSPKTKLSAVELDYLTDVDQQTHFAIAAVGLGEDESEGEGFGIARFVATAKPGAAEAAIAVADEAQGVGLGTLLFTRLIEAAAERGITHLTGEVLASNQAMLSIVKMVDGSTQPVASGVAKLEIPVPSAAVGSELPPDERHSELLRLFASGSAAIRDFLTWRR